jgi:hypothetical protein
MEQELLRGLITSGPIASLLLWLLWSERKERIDSQKKLENYLHENANRLLEFADEQRTTLSNLTSAVKDQGELIRSKWGK